MATASAPSTRRKRTTVWRHWIKFWISNDRDFDFLEPSQLHICLWIVSLFRRNYAYSTVRSYLFSLAAEIRFRGGKDFLDNTDSWFIHSTLRHYLRTKGTAP